MNTELTKLEEMLVTDITEGLAEFGMLFGQELRNYILGCMMIGHKTNPKKLNVIENVVLNKMEQIEFRKELQGSDYKQCACCKNVKPGTEFGLNKNQKDGLHYYCKECTNTKRYERRKINKPEHKKERKMKKVLQIDIETNQIIGIWKNVYEVESRLGFKQKTIRACCCGKIKKSKGYKWKYIEDAN